MCGIFSFLGSGVEVNILEEYCNKIKHRGPDNTTFKKIKDNLFFGFHRLMINGLDDQSNQPLYIKNNNDSIILICNGEIYNYEKLLNENNFNYKTKSDCEIIAHMYLKYGIKETLNQLDGVFSFVLYDLKEDKVIVSRDPLGIRSLFIGKTDSGEYGFCSEMKGLMFCNDVSQFPPGCYWDNHNPDKFNEYYSYNYELNNDDIETIKHKLHDYFTDAVIKRLMSERPVGCLLSGGLDSTLTAAIVKRYYGNINTYSIGLKGSVDLEFAKIAADYISSNHYEFEVTEKEFLDFIEPTIKQIESFCTTTVRASVGNFMISKFISENTTDKVIFCGDVSDEIFASYRGFMKAPNSDDFFRENCKLVKDVHMYDVLRSDKSISGAGLEARVPFADREFVDYVMSINPRHKMFNDQNMEKKIIRDAFKNTDLLPDELLYRRKEAFSDGVSSQSRSWFQIIREHVDKIIPDEEFEERCNKFTHCKPYDKESLYYREIYEKYYGTRNDKNIPYYWRHPFNTNLDPSARLLDCYNDNKDLNTDGNTNISLS